MKELLPTEAEEQIAFVEWLERKGLKFSAIPNSTFTGGYAGGNKFKNWGTVKKLHNMGLRKGLPDMVVVIPKVALVFIEMKRKKLSKTYPEQKEWIDALNSVENVGAYICKGADEAISIINQLI